MKYTIEHVELDGSTFEELVELDYECFPYDARMSFSGTRWWLATDEDGKAVAYAGLEHRYGDRGFLCRAGVLPEARGNGLQKRLIRARERGARSLSMDRLITYTDKHNVVSSNNLIACGYRLYRPEDEWGTPAALYWYRDL